MPVFRRLRYVAAVLAVAVPAAGCSADQPEGPAASDVGVTAEPCPEAVNPNHGCIYLGMISDLGTGPYGDVGRPATEGAEAFWRQVNEDGGIGVYDVDAGTFVRDGKYNAELHFAAYRSLKGQVLAFAQSLGPATPAAMLDDLRRGGIVAVPVLADSGADFRPELLESGASACVSGMTAVDAAGEGRVLTVRTSDAYAGDAAAGARAAAQRRGLPYDELRTDDPADAIAEIAGSGAATVVLAVPPEDSVTIVEGLASRDFAGDVYGAGPAWTSDMLRNGAVIDRYALADPRAVDTESPGYAALVDRLREDGVRDPSPGHVAGWVAQYPLKAALERAATGSRLTRATLLRAAGALQTADFQGLLPQQAADQRRGRAYRAAAVTRPDPDRAGATRTVQALREGSTATGHIFDRPCAG
ncbi:MAG: ABC transporter substrate-binding protein [Streptosporangiales bacterium]|nr:ABC transporter substrate-binding protein [Streptosporangiales bacterium]